MLQYKFIVDGEWRYDPSLQAAYDNDNNVNNVLEVREYVPENLESLAGFDPPPSPIARWVAHATDAFNVQKPTVWHRMRRTIMMIQVQQKRSFVFYRHMTWQIHQTWGRQNLDLTKMDHCWVLIKPSLCFSCGPYSILSPYHEESAYRLIILVLLGLETAHVDTWACHDSSEIYM